jgi:gamma-glutamyltranspeptidase/glutathione hydrolase
MAVAAGLKILAAGGNAADGFGEELPPYHPYTATVPGACAAWCDLMETFGKLNMDKVLAPAIRLADEGFPVAPIVAHGWALGVKQQLSTALNGFELTIDGRAPQAGEIFRNPGLARTFASVAAGGKEAFYEGEIAAALARTNSPANRVSEAGLRRRTPFRGRSRV